MLNSSKNLKKDKMRPYLVKISVLCLTVNRIWLECSSSGILWNME